MRSKGWSLVRYGTNADRRRLGRVLGFTRCHSRPSWMVTSPAVVAIQSSFEFGKTY